MIYAAALALFWHSIFTDPALKRTPLDPFDGEKVFIETCGAFVVVAGILRWRYAMRKPVTTDPHRSVTQGLRP